MEELLGAYVPLFIAFVVIFAGVWGWISFGPHDPTPQENWTRIESHWMPIRENARKEELASNGVFSLQVAGYKDYRDATRGWMNDLSKVSSWNDSKKTTDQNTTIASEMQTFITDGNTQADDLDAVVAAHSADDIIAVGDQIKADETTFNTDYGAVRKDLMGTAKYTITTGPTFVELTPSPGLCATPAPSDSAAPSDSPAPTDSLGASDSPGASPTACIPAPAGGSPSVSGSPSAGGSPAPTPTPTPTPTPSAGIVPSLTPSPSVKH